MKKKVSVATHSLAIFKKVFEHHHDAMAVIDGKGNIVMHNRMVMKIFGKKKTDLIGVSFQSLIPKSARAAFLRRLTDKTQYVQMEKEVLTFHAQTFAIDHQLMIVLTFHRLSYKNEIQRDLLLAKTSHRTLIELVVDDVFIMDRSMRLLYLNQYAADTFHRERHQLIGKKITDIFPKNAKHIKESVQNVLKTGKVFVRDSKFYFPDGTERWFRMHLIPICEEKSITAIFCVAHDVSDYKIAEETIYELEQNYEALVKNSSDGILVVQDGIIRFLNRRMENILVTSAKKSMGKAFVDFVVPDQQEGVFKRMHKALKKREKDMCVEFEIQVQKNQSRFIEAHGSYVVFDDKPAIMLIVRDRTQLKDVEKMRSDFIAIASHQMRTPLTGIKWFAELLKEERIGILNGDQVNYLDQIINSNERMVGLVDDLSMVARIEQETGKPLKVRLEDPCKLLKMTIEEQRDPANKKKQKIVFRACADSSIRLRLEKIKIHQVFQNILNNAIKYSPEGSEILIECRVENQTFVISVADHGLGIPEHQQPKLFQRFFRGDNVATTYGGTGLGMYVAKNFVEFHKGKIWFESKEGKGTTFFVALPIPNKKHSSHRRFERTG